jgi:cation transport regulator
LRVSGHFSLSLSFASRLPRCCVWVGGKTSTLPFHENIMPYHTLDDLPENVTNVLPKHAQEIYRAAFNSAWDEYRDPDERRRDASREETAHKVAWAAVKKEYEKDGDKWRRK